MRFLNAPGAIVMLLLAAPLSAHDFWLRPSAYTAQSGAPLPVAPLIGHGREVEPWALTWDRLLAFYSVGPNGVQDQQAGVIVAPAALPTVTATLDGAGTHIVAMESYPTISVLPADKFNAYAELEGLSEALRVRKAGGAMGKPGRERYSRRAKALVQVGDTLSDTVTRPIGHTLEIVPERNPYAPSADKLPVRVLFQGRPLAGALIDVTALDIATEPFQRQRTDADGRASFDIPRKGAWKLNVIWARPTTGRPDAEFDTVFASFTFGYGKDSPGAP